MVKQEFMVGGKYELRLFTLEPSSRFAASAGNKRGPSVIAKERSDCGNLNPCAKRKAYFLRKRQVGILKSQRKAISDSSVRR